MMFPKDAKEVSGHMVIDKFIQGSTKSVARKIRGESNSVRVNVMEFDQKVFSTTKGYHLALPNTITKKSMYLLLMKFLESGKAPLIYPTKMIEPSSENVTILFVRDYEEADWYTQANMQEIRPRYASLQGTANVMIVAYDIVFLETYIWGKNNSRRYFNNYEASTYADLVTFAAFL